MDTLEKKAEGGRVEVYDWLRLIATVFVVIGHSAYLDLHTEYGGIAYEVPGTVSWIYTLITGGGYIDLSRWVYGFHMPLFFMLSGAVLALRPMGTFDEIVKSKAKRLLIPYFVCGWLFMLPVKRIGNFYNNESFLQALKGFLSGHDSGHLWFLAALFWCIVIFVCLKKILSKAKVHSIYALLFIAGIIQLTYDFLPFDVLKLKTGLQYIFYFALGYCFEYERKVRQWNLRKVITAFTIVLAVEILNSRYEILDDFFVVLSGSFMAYLLADVCSRIFKRAADHAVWNLVIRNLFYVYLFHDPLEYLMLRIFMRPYFLSSSVGCILYVLSRTVGVFVISILLGICVSRIKSVCKKWLEY